MAGILSARWIPDSQQIMTVSKFCLRATIYSLTDGKEYYIKNPKFADRGCDFTVDGKFMCLAERKDAKDYLGIYYTNGWTLVNHFEVKSQDLDGLKWSPDNSVIAVWDSAL